MKQDYRRTRTSVSLINYHIVFCPRYRRKVFLVPGFEDRFKSLVYEIAVKNDYQILALECHVDHCHIFISVPPSVSAAEAVKVIKTNTSRVLRAEFDFLSKAPTLWTRSYFASTAGNVSSDTIKRYVDSQKTRG